MKIGEIPFYWQILDLILLPIMWIGHGFKKETFQETHPWHLQKFNSQDIADKDGIRVVGLDSSPFSKENPLSHLPIFGGWKEYVVLEAKNYQTHWHVGWKFKWGDTTRYQINKLKLSRPRIKMLSGPSSSSTIFIGFNEKGEVIPLKKVGSGVVGDKKYPDIRLL